MRSKAYRAIAVNRLDEKQLLQSHEGQDVVVGFDVGKFKMIAMPRWADGTFDRPWLIHNPESIAHVVGLLRRFSRNHRLTIALEPSGTYGDPLRQALGDAALTVHRVSPKAVHDQAETFDGVPSQHDGKDAAIVADLASRGKSWPWPFVARSEWEQELAYWVDWLDAYRRIRNAWMGRLEALLARHWPEATRVMPLATMSLLQALERYGSPAALAADPQAVANLTRWGKGWLSPARVQQLLDIARHSMGVRVGPMDRQRIQNFAQQAIQATRQVAKSRRQLRRLAKDRPILQAQGKALGVPTACVLWACVGDPHAYGSAAAYRKAMGLNLAERSSGTYQGRLHLSKRGQPMTRRWLYLAAARAVRRYPAVRAWFQAKKARGGQSPGRVALVGIMRRLALAAHRIAVTGGDFDPNRLFPSTASKPRGKRKTAK